MPKIIIARDEDDLARRGAERIVQAARDAIGKRGRFAIALTGGSTPERTYEELAKRTQNGEIDWGRVFAFWGDERFVPPDDPRSNYGMAWRSLLDKVPIPDANIWPIPTLTDTLAQSAGDYEDTLRQFFEIPIGGPPPRFDLVLLGLGGDGHVASLFPGFPTLDVTDRWVVSSPPGTLPPPVDRVTMTFPVLNNGRHILFLVSGDKKAGVLADILEGHPTKEQRPAIAVQPTDGTLTWLLDTAAASQLKNRESGDNP